MLETASFVEKRRRQAARRYCRPSDSGRHQFSALASICVAFGVTGFLATSPASFGIHPWGAALFMRRTGQLREISFRVRFPLARAKFFQGSTNRNLRRTEDARSHFGCAKSCNDIGVQDGSSGVSLTAHNRVRRASDRVFVKCCWSHRAHRIPQPAR